jgi:hypothetical protein
MKDYLSEIVTANDPRYHAPALNDRNRHGR